MKIIAVVNFKGGCGKTSTAVNLAACLGEQKRKVLLMDLDPQLSATQWMNQPLDSRGLYDVFCGDANLDSLVTPTSANKVDMIPGSRWMIGLDKALSGEIGAEVILKKALEQLPERWDVVLLDCPPATGLISLNALCAATDILIPLELSVLNTGGLVHILKTVDQVKDRINPDLEILGIVPCRVDRRTRLAKEVLGGLQKRFGSLVTEISISESVKMRECPSFGEPITKYDPKGRATEDYRKLSKEIFKRIKKYEQVTTG